MIYVILSKDENYKGTKGGLTFSNGVASTNCKTDVEKIVNPKGVNDIALNAKAKKEHQWCYMTLDVYKQSKRYKAILKKALLEEKHGDLEAYKKKLAEDKLKAELKAEIEKEEEASKPKEKEKPKTKK